MSNEPRLLGGCGKTEDAFPLSRRVLRDREDRGRVRDVHADRGLGRQRSPGRSEELERRRASPRGVDGEIGDQRLGLAVRRRVPRPGHRVTVRPDHEILRTALLTQLDAGMRLDASAHSELQLSSGLRIRIEAKITLGEGIVARPFCPDIQPGSDRDGAHCRDVTVEAGEQLAQRLLTAGQQDMHVPALRDARTIFRVLGQRVALQHQDALEVVRQRARRCQSTHARTEDQRLSTDDVRHHDPPSRVMISLPVDCRDWM